MWPFGGHLGTSVSALVDGQLDPEAAEQAWAHVERCPACSRLVEREGWVKRRLAQMAYRTGAEPQPSSTWLSAEAMEAWATVYELEERGRGRRRAGLALVGAGSVSVAVIGLTALSAAPLGIGTASDGTPAGSLSRGASTATPTSASAAPRGRVHDRIRGWTVTHPGNRATYAVPTVGPH